MAACSMKEPVCLIESDSDGRLHVVPGAQEILQQIEQPVVVVSVVGLCRTGKSYLMNKLAGTNKGFPLGSTIQSETKGIWMWCVPHPRKTDHTLVLLDTEGLGDIEKGDTTHDNWIFAIAVLLSSTLVYNSMGTIDNKALENLHYVTVLTKHIKMKSHKDGDDDQTYVRFLPSFVWSVRDFSLVLNVAGKPITADQYLEHALKDKQGDENQRYNKTRGCIRKFFLPRACFVFERPANSKKMQRLEELTDKDLDEDFVEQARKFTEHVYTKSETKTIGDGIKVTGILLGQLAETYVKAIQSGEVPCLEDAVVALADVENAKAVEQAQALYVQRMKSVRLPTSTLEELHAIHASSEREALALFMKHSFRDDSHEYQKRLMSVLQGEYNQICEKNKVMTGGMSKCAADGREVKAEGGLKAYLDEKDKEIISNVLRATDKSLSEAQRREGYGSCLPPPYAIDDPLLERQMADQQKTQEENMKQINEKMDREKIQYEKLMAELKQKERADKVEALRLELQMQALQTQKALEEKQNKPTLVEGILDTGLNIALQLLLRKHYPSI